jgi:ribosomal protein S6--L-glutamate ligase
MGNIHPTPQTIPNSILSIGWQEWVCLPNLHLPLIKAKIDTGAKTSALHASNISEFWHGSQKWVQFDVHPLQRNNHYTVNCSAKVIDERVVTNSSGSQELRYVIKTPMLLGPNAWEIELTLTQRHDMTFRMLLGREALRHRVIIDLAHVCLQGKFTQSKVRKAYGLPKLPRQK